MFYNDFRNRISFLPRPILNVMDFVEGMYDGYRYTYVDKGFWHDAGYGLVYALTGWYQSYRDDYREMKRRKKDWTREDNNAN